MEYREFHELIENGFDRKYMLKVRYGKGRSWSVVSGVKYWIRDRELYQSMKFRDKSEEEVRAELAPLLKRVDERLRLEEERNARLKASIQERNAEEADMIRRLRVAAGSSPDEPISLRVLSAGPFISNPLERVLDRIVRIREDLFLPEDRDARAKALIDLDNLLGDFFDKLNS